MNNQSLLDLLLRLYRQWKRVLVASELLRFMGGGLIVILLADAYDRWDPLQERTAFWFLLAGGFICSGIIPVIWGGYRTFSRYDRLHWARQIDRAHPEFKDAVTTAAEFAHIREHNNLFIDLTCRKVWETLQKEGFPPSLRRQYQQRLLGLGYGIFLLIIGWGWIFCGNLPIKGWNYFGDWYQGQCSGLSIVPGDQYIPIGEDLTILIEVLRGPKEPIWIEFQKTVDVEPNSSQRVPVVLRQDKKMVYFLPNVRESFRYRIMTPTLTSRWYLLQIFERPRIHHSSVQVDPPFYTAIEPYSVDLFNNWELPQDSQVRIVLSCSTPVQLDLVGHLRDEKNEVHFRTDNFNHQSELTFTVTREGKYELYLLTPQSYRVLAGDPWMIHLKPNQFPWLDIQQPLEETLVCDRQEEIVFKIVAGDDYGIHQVRFALGFDGDSQKKIVLWPQNSQTFDRCPKEVQVSYQLKIDDQLQYGDILSYFFEVEDNTLPNPLVYRSPLRFIEIMPKDGASPDNREMIGERGEKPEIALRIHDLILILKQIIRDTFALIPLGSDIRKTDHDKLIESIRSLIREIEVRYEVIQREAQKHQLDPGKIGTLFQDAIRDLKKALTFVEQMAWSSALSYEHSALKIFKAIELLLWESQKKRSGQGLAQKPFQGKSSQSSSSDQDSQQKENKNQNKEDRLIEIIRKLKEQIWRQRDCSDYAKRLELQDPIREDWVNQLKTKQVDVRREIQAIRDKLYELFPDFSEPRQFLLDAENKMREGEAELSNQFLTSELIKRYGILSGRVVLDMQRAFHFLEELLNSIDQEQLQNFIQRFQSLAQQQESLRRETQQSCQNGRKLTDSQAQNLRAQQRTLRQSLSTWQQELLTEIATMQEHMPEVSRKLEHLIRDPQFAQILREMERSEQALGYRLGEKSVQYQQLAEQALQSIGEKLQQLLQQHAQSSLQQLVRALSESLKMYHKMQSMDLQEFSPENREKWLGEVKKLFKDLHNRLGLTPISMLQRRLEMLDSIQDPQLVKDTLVSNLAQLTQIIETQLKEILNQQPNSGILPYRSLPPMGFKKLVEEYFKNLNEDRTY